ncbi:MAG: polysaccharide biosynthesis tyrosine autokinase [Chitinophagales bacterium]|nr:polysaccharide biosynthesis tyrosine autokinase [Chitinophagales bacterium]
MEKEPLFSNEKFSDEDINVRLILDQYLRYWPLYLVFIIIFSVGAYLYLKYSIPVYQATSSILIEKENQSLMVDFSSIEDLFGGNKVVEDQMLVVKSLPVLMKVVDNLLLDVKVTRKTKYTQKTVGVYDNRPFIIERKYLNGDIKDPLVFKIEIIDLENYQLTYNEKTYKFPFGKPLQIPELVSFKLILKKDLPQAVEGEEYTITLNPITATLLNLQENLVVEQAIKSSKVSNAINLSIESSNENKSKDILNNVVQEYFNNDILSKKIISEKTYAFIQDRLGVISTELSGVESDLEKYKTTNKVYSIVDESRLFADNSMSTKQSLTDAELQLSIVNLMLGELNTNKNEILPVNIGLADVNIAVNIKAYNDLVLQDMQYKSSVSELNPERIALSKSISSLRENIKASLNNLRVNNQMLVNNLRKQDKILEGELSLIPNKERVLRDISRQQQTKEALFLFLMQKREEVAISTISIKPDAKIVSPAFSSGVPISPQKGKIILIFLVLGLIIPTVIIYVLSLLDTKIHNLSELERLSPIPVLSSIVKTRKPETKILEKDDRRGIVESFRVLVTNLVFSLSHISDSKSKTIMLTSTIAGEGKTFISSNLAAFLAYSNNKVVLLGMDFRAPKLNLYFKNVKNKGITHFIKEENLEIEDIVNSTNVEGLDVIYPGLIAPVFLDITKSDRLRLMMDQLKEKYDYIIIDSAPVGLVSETLSLFPFVDMCLYIVRADHLDKRALKISEKLYNEGRFADFRLVLNAEDIRKSEYGYGNYGKYGGYGAYGDFEQEEKYKIWQYKYWKDLFS